MKSDLGKLIILAWLSAMLYFTYCISIDVQFIADIIHAYVSMTMEHIKH